MSRQGQAGVRRTTIAEQTTSEIMTMREKLDIAFNPPRYDVAACLDALGFALIPLCVVAMCVIGAIQHQKPPLLVVALIPLGVALMLVHTSICDLLDFPVVRIRRTQMMRRRLSSPTIWC